MISVTVGTNLSRETIIVPPATTIKKVLEENHVNYEKASLHLDGAVLKSGEINKTLADFGITERCSIIAVTKIDNA